jgi:hypothetical protein
MLGRMQGLVVVLGVAAALAGAHGCAKERTFGADGTADGPDEGVGSLLPGDGEEGSESQPANLALVPSGALGSACAVGSGCDSGFCVAGRCCESTCDGVCEACSESGRCLAAPADDVRCPELTCTTASSTCATFPASQTANRCQSAGVCKTACDPLTVALDTACEEVAPGINGVCNAAGNCIDPRSTLGARCESNIDCSQGTCIDGVCCGEPCAAACETCDASGACVADASGTACGDGLACFGRGTCLAPNGSACQTGAECGSGNCVAAVGSGSVCCAEPCAGGLLCNGSGTCISPEADLGNACTGDADCVGGRCFDGVCCDSECGAACERCNAAGLEGRCTAEPGGTQDPACTAGQECASRGQCLSPLGAVCSLNGECRSGECGAALQGSGEICCEAACPQGQRCSPTGSCVDAPDPDGSACAIGADCLSNNCVDGRCCGSACNGVCEACSGLGDCNLSPGNDPACPAVDCPASSSVCITYPPDVTTNLCAGFGACRSIEQDCQPQFASAGTACENVAPGVLGICDGAGVCRDPRVGLGAQCTAGSQCASGNCSARVGGGSVCCDAACGGVCEACSSAGVCELRDNGLCPIGQQCGSRTSCAPRSVAAGASCANGEACSGGAVCFQGVCRGPCLLADSNATDGSRFDECVLAP